MPLLEANPIPSRRPRGLRLASRLFWIALLLASPVLASAAPSAGPADAATRKAREDFSKLGLKMLGTATIMGDTSVILSRAGWTDTMTFGVGRVIGGFRITSIQPGYTIFEKSGIHIWLPIGGDADRRAQPDRYADVAEAASSNHKRAEPGTKVAVGAAIGSGRVLRSVNDVRALTSPAVKTPSTSVASAGGARGYFAAPLDGDLSSGFGYRQRPMGGASRYHRGVDIAAKHGTPIVASANGIVKAVSRNWSKGVFIELEHGSGYESHYLHMSRTAVKAGQTVRQGQVIGYVGSTGISTGPHLHFEIHRNGQALDPALFVKEYDN